mgnify:CR=1 FL=1
MLFGDYNPNGKLPFTYPRSTNNHLTYDHKIFEVEATAFGTFGTPDQQLILNYRYWTAFD